MLWHMIMGVNVRNSGRKRTEVRGGDNYYNCFCVNELRAAARKNEEYLNDRGILDMIFSLIH